MAQQVYSKRLWSILNATTIGATLGPIVPAGFVWVVRDIRAINLQQDGTVLFEFQVLVHNGPIIFATPLYSTIGGLMYSWEGRAVVNAGEQLELSIATSGWDVVVDGYELSTP